MNAAARAEHDELRRRALAVLAEAEALLRRVSAEPRRPSALALTTLTPPQRKDPT